MQNLVKKSVNPDGLRLELCFQYHVDVDAAVQVSVVGIENSPSFCTPPASQLRQFCKQLDFRCGRRSRRRSSCPVRPLPADQLLDLTWLLIYNRLHTFHVIIMYVCVHACSYVPNYVCLHT